MRRKGHDVDARRIIAHRYRHLCLARKIVAPKHTPREVEQLDHLELSLGTGNLEPVALAGHAPTVVIDFVHPAVTGVVGGIGRGILYRTVGCLGIDQTVVRIESARFARAARPQPVALFHSQPFDPQHRAIAPKALPQGIAHLNSIDSADGRVYLGLGHPVEVCHRLAHPGPEVVNHELVTIQVLDRHQLLVKGDVNLLIRFAHKGQVLVGRRFTALEGIKPLVRLAVHHGVALDEIAVIALAKEFLGEDNQVLKNAINKVFVNYEKYGLQYIFSSEPHDGVSVDYIAWECSTMNAARIMLGNALSNANTQHNYGDWVRAVEPDNEHDGLEIRTCADCSAQESRSISHCDSGMHSYTYTDNGDGTHTCLCTECGYKAIEEHSEEIVPAVEPTCTSEGLTEGLVCSDCGAVIKAQLPVEKLPHTPGEWYYVSGGVFERECTVCHNIVDVQEVELTLSDDSITLTNGDTAKLDASAASFTNIVFSSENSKIATVDATGKITAKAPGETAIIVKVEGTDIEKACKVTVEPKAYTATWIIDGVSQTTTVKEGDAIVPPEVEVIPGYRFTGWSPAVPDKMPSENLTFTAVFEPIINITSVSIVPVNTSDEKSGQVIYHQVPWYMSWTSQSVDLTVQTNDNSKIASVQWVYANWSETTPEANILNSDQMTATIRPTWGIGARSCWVQAIVTDIYGNKTISDPVKVRFYNWDWQK